MTRIHALTLVNPVLVLPQAGVTVPLVLMGYYNPMLAYGMDRLAADSAAAGINGTCLTSVCMCVQNTGLQIIRHSRINCH